MVYELVDSTSSCLQNILFFSHQACMLTFYPEFEVPQLKKPDVTIILDCSNSMKGESFEHAKKLCYMIASLMPKRYTVNIIKFDTGK